MDELMKIADRLLDRKPDPIPEFILLKEFKLLDPSGIALQNAYMRVCDHPMVKGIAENQNSRGFWPPFHGYSEVMIKRCLSLGLDKDHPCLQKAAGYLQNVLHGNENWDQHEKQDNIRWWPEMFVPLVSAAMLSLIDENNAVLLKQRKQWAGFAATAFAAGTYNREAEHIAQCEHFGFKTSRTIPAYGYYNLILLGSKADGLLPDDASQALVDHCMNEAEQMYYVYNCKLKDCPPMHTQSTDSRDFCHWLRALGIVSRFKGFEKYKGKYMDWVMEQRNADGLWELPKRYDLHNMPLSNSWRGKHGRTIDSTIMVMRFIKGIHLY